MFNAETQIDGKGILIPQEKTTYVWLDHDINDERAKVYISDLSPIIHTPLKEEPKDVLQKMILRLKVCMKQNFESSLIIIGAAIMTFQYDTITAKYGGLPNPTSGRTI